MIDKANGKRIERRIQRLVAEGKIARAQGTEAQRAETVQLGSVHDGPVRVANAPQKPPPSIGVLK